MANGDVHDSEANVSQDYTNAAATSPPKPLSVHDEDPTSYPPTPTALLGPRETIAIPPPDTGYAWTFLCAGFTIGATSLVACAGRTIRANRPELTYTSHLLRPSTTEMLAFGFVFSIGIFHEYWSTSLFPGPANASTITICTTLCSGLLYLGAAIIGPLLARYPQHRAAMQYLGLALSVSGIIAAAFATKPWHLVLFAGIMYPIGACTYYMPAATLLFTWWQRRRGFAAGIMYSGTGVGESPIIGLTFLPGDLQLSTSTFR